LSAVVYLYLLETRRSLVEISGWEEEGGGRRKEEGGGRRREEEGGGRRKEGHLSAVLYLYLLETRRSLI
jgi:hypothetical protein